MRQNAEVPQAGCSYTQETQPSEPAARTLLAGVAYQLSFAKLVAANPCEIFEGLPGGAGRVVLQ